MNIKNSTLIRAIASCFLCSVFLALAVWTVSGSQRSSGVSERPSGASQRPSGTCDLPPPDAFQTTKQYVETFYPLWFTNNQAHPSDYNVLVGPERVSPLYHSVVMINDDTVYCSAFLNLNPNDPRGGEPMAILTVPSTGLPGCSDDFSVTYSHIEPLRGRVALTLTLTYSPLRYPPRCSAHSGGDIRLCWPRLDRDAYGSTRGDPNPGALELPDPNFPH
jgi:hypothetical protein